MICGGIYEKFLRKLLPGALSLLLFFMLYAGVRVRRSF